jgi:hypothetical protein
MFSHERRVILDCVVGSIAAELAYQSATTVPIHHPILGILGQEEWKKQARETVSNSTYFSPECAGRDFRGLFPLEKIERKGYL